MPHLLVSSALCVALLLALTRAGAEPQHGSLLKGRPKILGVHAVSTKCGVLVRCVAANTPAHRTGLEAGDRIIRVNGYEVGIVDGKEYSLASRILRSGRSYEMKVALGCDQE